jgi:hypothetical protein
VKIEPLDRFIALAEIATGIGLLGFWAAFFTVGLAPDPPPRCYYEFEHAFVVPDVILSAALIGAGIMLLKGVSRGRILSLAAAGGLMFLGVLDLCFNLQAGTYLASAVDGTFNLSINLWCAGLGLFTIIRFNGAGG